MTSPSRPSHRFSFRVFGFAAAAASMLLLSGCVVPVDSGMQQYGMPYDPVARHNYGGDNTDAYRKGYSFGRSDARQGRAHNYVRYGNEYSSLTKSQFVDGYMKAYAAYKNSPDGGWDGNSGGWNNGYNR